MAWVAPVISAVGSIAGGLLGQGGGKSSSTSETTQSIFLQDYFRRLFGNAEGAAKSFDTGGLQNTASDLFTSGTGFLESLQSQASGTDASGEYLKSRLSGDNGVLNEQIKALGTDLGNFYNQELLPGINSDAVAGGQLGGGRQGVAQGLAATGVAQQFASGSASLRASDQAQRLQAALGLGNQTGAAGIAGLQGITPLMDLANTGYNAKFSPLLTLAQILGNPTILTHQTSSSKGSSSTPASFNFTYSPPAASPAKGKGG